MDERKGIETIQRVKKLVEEKLKIKTTDSLTPHAFEFTLNIKREPKFKINGNPFTGLFSINVEHTRNGQRQIAYSGSCMNEKDILYMIFTEVEYYQKLK